MQKIFEEKILDALLKCNMNVADSLDGTLILDDGTYKPYKKSNNKTKHIKLN